MGLDFAGCFVCLFFKTTCFFSAYSCAVHDLFTGKDKKKCFDLCQIFKVLHLLMYNMISVRYHLRLVLIKWLENGEYPYEIAGAGVFFFNINCNILHMFTTADTL